MEKNIYYYSSSDININLIDNDTEYIIELNALGLRKEDINIKIKGTILSIEGKKKDSTEDENNYLVRGFVPSVINKDLEIPSDIDTNSGVDVKLECGILKIYLKKSPEKVVKINFK